jgi:nicotinamide mononucleotide transporter
MWAFILEAIYYFQENHLELWGTVFGIACVWFNAKELVWGWPTGIISVGLYAYIFFVNFLYADVGLHVIYVALGFYGWYNWLRGHEGQEMPISTMRWPLYAKQLLLSVLGTVLLGWLLGRYTQASVPYWDAGITCFSLAAQWQLTQKKLENWLTWIAVDVVCIGVYYYKALYITTFLYVVYLLLAIWGYWRWREALLAKA